MAKKKKRICCITGSRAEYSRLKSVFRYIVRHRGLELQIVCTGTHLLDRYGLSVKDIRDDGFEIAEECFVLIEGENPVTMGKSIGLAIIEFATILQKLRPDVLLIMGDRAEAFASAVAGATLNIPLAHIQGGELSGSIDESYRHAITKFSHLHFPATELSRKRLIQMGEDPGRVFNVGCPSVDELLSTRILPKEELFRRPEIMPVENSKVLDPSKPYILAMQHPVTTEYGKEADVARTLVDVLYGLDMQVLFIWPNADAGSRGIVRAVDKFFFKHSKRYFEHYDHIPYELFISLMANADLMVGNSSAGIREACYFGTPVVNIGHRQQNRERPGNVVDVPEVTKRALLSAIKRQLRAGRYPKDFLYGRGDSGKRIAELLYKVEIGTVQKSFCDRELSEDITKLKGCA